MGTTVVCFQVFSQPLEVVIRNPTHRLPSCDSSPLLIFSTIGEDDVCGEPDCVRVFIDGVEVSISRVGEAYGYDYYGPDDQAGVIPGPCDPYGYGYSYGYGYGYGYGYSYGYSYGDGYYGYGYDDGSGYDGYYGTIDDGLGADRLPGTLHIFTLPEIEDGLHTLRVVVRGTSGIESEATENFIIDTTPPVIDIITPENQTLVPLSECPVLEYTLTDFTGVADVNVNIDGTDYGWLSSGTELSFLKSGLHTLTLSAIDISTGSCGTGNESLKIIQFNVLKPIKITEIPQFFFLGTDATTKSKPADGIFEEVRLLNGISTEFDALSEFKLLRAQLQFQLREGEAVISPDEALLLQEIGETSERLNLPDQTLLLCHYDNNIQSEEAVGELANPTNQVIDPLVAGRRVDVTVYYREGDNIDRELIVELVNRIIPAFAEANVTFEEVQQ